VNNQSPSYDSLSMTQKLQLKSFKPSNADEFFANLTRIGVKFSRPRLESAAAAGTQMKNMKPGSLPIATVQGTAASAAVLGTAAQEAVQGSTAAAAVLGSAAQEAVQGSTAAAEQGTAASAAELGSAAPEAVQGSTAAAEQGTAASAAELGSAAPEAVQGSTAAAEQGTAASAAELGSAAPEAVQGSAAPATKSPAAKKRPPREQNVGNAPNSDNSKTSGKRPRMSCQVYAATSRGGKRNSLQIDFGMGEPNICFHQVRHCCLTIGCADFIAGQVLFPVQYCSVNQRA
jgi:hypothetical protein